MKFAYFICLLLIHGFCVAATRTELRYAPSPADNPLKGLVPYAGAEGFPHSMEFGYLPMSAIVVAEDQYDWSALDKLIDAVARRGHQTVFRIYLEYPGKKGGVPAYLLQRGVNVNHYAISRDGKTTSHETPDYENLELRKCIAHFIAAMGKRYDGEMRVGFIFAGILGYWGEWHTSDRNDLWASKAVQNEVMDAYESAFKTTKILLRYPAGADEKRIAPNAMRPFGYHDDSFAWATLDTGNKRESWFFMAAMHAAGGAAVDKWKTLPIGGEIRPEAWGIVFDADPGNAKVQPFDRCVDETHASWMLDSGMARKANPADRIKRAETSVRRMGYDFCVPAVTIQKIEHGHIAITIELTNRGVAPFYYNWPHELALIASDHHVAKMFAGKGALTGLLPGDPPRIWNESLDLSGITVGNYTLALRVPNPMPGGIPLRFANETQDCDLPGWLTLTTVTITSAE